MTLQPEDLAPASANGLVLTIAESANVWAPVPLGALPAHATTHQNGGSDEVSVAGLSGLLADAQTPLPEVLALVDLTDVTAKTGIGTTVVMDTEPTIVSPIISQVSDQFGNQVLGFGGAAPNTNSAIINNSAGSDPVPLYINGGVSLNVITTGAGTIQRNGVPVATTTDTQTLTNKSLTIPAISDFTNAQHDHSNAAGGGALGAGSVSLALADLTDVTAVTGTGTVVVMQGSPSITTPTIASFANSAHNHQDAAGGATLDHGLALTGLSDDDHTQYALLAGRAGGQTLYGGTGVSNNLNLRSTSNASKGEVVMHDPITMIDQAANPNAAGELQRNGAALLFHDGTAARTLVSKDATETLSNKTLATPDIPNFTSAQHTHQSASGGGALSTAALTSGTMATARLGSGSASSSTFLRGDSTWAAATAAGSLLNIQYLFNGTTTYTPTSGTATAVVMGVASGAGGGGAAQAAVQTAGAAGGGGGGWFLHRVTGITGTYTVAIGAGGAGGTAGNNNGTDGADTTFANGATTYTAKKGVGGTGSAAGTVGAFVTGGSGGAVSTNASVNAGGESGQYGMRLSGTVSAAGVGGSGPWGGGGLAATTERAGFAGTGYGSGGGGANCLGTTARAGGAGMNGIMIIWEYS